MRPRIIFHFLNTQKKNIRKAAVVILIINDNQKQIVFTKRTNLLKKIIRIKFLFLVVHMKKR